MVVQYLTAFKIYLIDVLPFLAIGFLLSGLIHEFVPSQWVERRLGGSGIKPILYSTLIGTILPICCLGSLPVAVSLRQKGARLGPVLAFLVATPATSITALLVTYGLLGLKFTVFIFFAVIAMGLVMGLVGNKVEGKAKVIVSPAQQALDPVCGMSVEVGKAAKTEYGGETYYFCCSHCQQAFEHSPEEYMREGSRQVAHRIKHVFRYAFVDMVKEIGPELLLALALAALVAAVAPVGEFVGAHFGGGLGYLFSLGFGLIMYICSTASVPLVHAFVSQGMNIGAGMVLLLVGPITSWGTILVLRKEFGGRILASYLAVVCVLSLALGYCFSLI
ncbi:MAG: YHS domain-containing protein [Dehalococcoidia bacterium]|nr:MAG: YHS domain-containing protein [Dehalococcoidia bacterium]